MLCGHEEWYGKRRSVRPRSGPPLSPSLPAICRHRPVAFRIREGCGEGVEISSFQFATYLTYEICVIKYAAIGEAPQPAHDGPLVHPLVAIRLRSLFGSVLPTS